MKMVVRAGDGKDWEGEEAWEADEETEVARASEMEVGVEGANEGSETDAQQRFYAVRTVANRL